MTNSFIVVDLETTGISPTANAITEIGAIKVLGEEIVGTYSQLINPETEVSQEITRITGLTNEMLDDKPTFAEIAEDFLEFSGDLPLLGHNILFDYSFLKYHLNQLGYPYERKGMDTLRLASYYLPDLPSKSLASLVEYFEIDREIAHRAYHDAKATYEVFRFLKDEYRKPGEDGMFDSFALHWKPKKSSPITPRQKSYLEALIEKHQVYKELDVDGLSKSEASRYIDKILFTKGR